MESQSQSQSQQVTVEVPEDRVAEFHAFFARFLEGPGRRGRRGRRARAYEGHRGHRHEGHRGRRCAQRREAAEQSAPDLAPAEPSREQTDPGSAPTEV